jgi:hypothetical protein
MKLGTRRATLHRANIQYTYILHGAKPYLGHSRRHRRLVLARVLQWRHVCVGGVPASRGIMSVAFIQLLVAADHLLTGSMQLVAGQGYVIITSIHCTL